MGIRTHPASAARQATWLAMQGAILAGRYTGSIVTVKDRPAHTHMDNLSAIRVTPRLGLIVPEEYMHPRPAPMR